MRESETRWRGLFQGLKEGFILRELVRDERGHVVDWRYLDRNAAWGELVGIPPEVATGRTLCELFFGIEDGWVEEIAVMVATREPTTFKRQNGSAA